MKNYDDLVMNHEKLHTDLNRLLGDVEKLTSEEREERYNALLAVSEKIIAELLDLQTT